MLCGHQTKLLACLAQEELDKLKFFAKPKLALDAVGGVSAVRICEALTEVCLCFYRYLAYWSLPKGATNFLMLINSVLKDY